MFLLVRFLDVNFLGLDGAYAIKGKMYTNSFAHFFKLIFSEFFESILSALSKGLKNSPINPSVH